MNSGTYYASKVKPTAKYIYTKMLYELCLLILNSGIMYELTFFDQWILFTSTEDLSHRIPRVDIWEPHKNPNKPAFKEGGTAGVYVTQDGIKCFKTIILLLNFTAYML